MKDRLDSRASAILALMLASTVALSSCGGGSSSSDTSTERQPSAAAAGTGPSRAEKPLRGDAEAESGSAAGSGSASESGSPTEASSESYPRTAASAAAAERRAKRRGHVVRRRLERKAGRAAPFLVAEGDNSIPTFGHEAPASARAEVEAVLSRYLQARAARDWPTACSLMLPLLQRQAAALAGMASGKGADCAKAYATLAEHGSPAEWADPMAAGVAAVRLESPHSFALFFGPGGQQYMMPLEEESGAWRVTQIAPVTWPIGAG